MKKIPKFFSCLNVVKETYLEIESFLSISQKKYTFRESRDHYFPFSKLLCATNVFSCRGNYPKDERGHEFIPWLT